MYCCALQAAHKTFIVKRKLGRKQKQNRPIPQWVRMKTGNKIRCVLYVSASAVCILVSVMLHVSDNLLMNKCWVIISLLNDVSRSICNAPAFLLYTGCLILLEILEIYWNYFSSWKFSGWVCVSLLWLNNSCVSKRISRNIWFCIQL